MVTIGFTCLIVDVLLTFGLPNAHHLSVCGFCWLSLALSARSLACICIGLFWILSGCSFKTHDRKCAVADVRCFQWKNVRSWTGCTTYLCCKIKGRKSAKRENFFRLNSKYGQCFIYLFDCWRYVCPNSTLSPSLELIWNGQVLPLLKFFHDWTAFGFPFECMCRLLVFACSECADSFLNLHWTIQMWILSGYKTHDKMCAVVDVRCFQWTNVQS